MKNILLSQQVFRKHKIIIMLVLACVVAIIVFVSVQKNQGFNTREIVSTLSEGTELIFKQEIAWQKIDGKYIGFISISSISTDVEYTISDKELISKVVLHNTKYNQEDNIPCLNLIHLFPKEQIKTIYSVLLKDRMQTNKKTNSQVGDNLFIDYHYIKTTAGIENYCRIYRL